MKPKVNIMHIINNIYVRKHIFIHSVLKNCRTGSFMFQAVEKTVNE